MADQAIVAPAMRAAQGAVSGMRDRAERIFGLTMATGIRPWGRVFLPLLFGAARHWSAVTAPLQRLAFIRAAHWTILKAVPDGKGGWRRLHPPVLLFESNYDVDLAEYIDVFARTLPWRMRGVWASGYGYPGLFPTSGFNAWVDQHRAEPGHYWCAYPEATTRMVGAGLRIEERMREFRAAVEGAAEGRFAAEYDRFLTGVQHDL